MAPGKTTVWDNIRDGLRNWSIPKQLAGADANSTAARSTLSQTLRPRLEEADRVGTQPDEGSGRRQHPDASSLTAQCQEAVEKLTHALHLPPRQVSREVDEVENIMARIRDILIQQLRSDDTSPAAPRQRAALTRINAALSLIVGVEYPVAGIQRTAIEQARAALT